LRVGGAGSAKGMNRHRAVLLASALLALGLVACGGDDDDDTTVVETETTTTSTEETQPETNAPAPSGEAVRSAKVAMVDFSFEAPTVTIQAGGKVTWQNEGEAPHTATADDGSFDTGTVDPGKVKSEAAAFKQPGKFSYICEIHPQMKGTVEVVP
jgi:plastocyanin